MVSDIVKALAGTTPALRDRYLQRLRTQRTPQARQLEQLIIDQAAEIEKERRALAR